MSRKNIYKTGDYYRDTYCKNMMQLDMARRWMENYYLAVKQIFPNISHYQGKSILEIGSGFGGFIDLLNKRHFKKVTASDINSSIYYKNKLLNEFLTIDIKKGINKKFDLIFAFDVFEHIINLNIVLKVIKRLLNDNGLLLFSVPYPIKKHLLDRYHINMHYPNYYTNLFQQNDFQLLNYETFSIFPYIWRFRFPILIKGTINNKNFITETFYAFQKKDATKK